MDEIGAQLVALVEKLKGKSVYSNLKKISEGKCEDKLQEIIGVSSLLTHSLIEMKTHKKYKILSSNLVEKIAELFYNL